MLCLFRIYITVPVILLLGLATAHAKAVDITADEITRDKNGVVIANGNVTIKRESDTLVADQVIYRAKEHILEAHGQVILKSDKATIYADRAYMDTENKTGTMQKAIIILPGGERMTAERVKRIDENTLEAEEIIFSSCPIDQESWRIAAKRALLNQKDATLTAEHSRFELWQIPILYTPWWQQPLKRKTGLIMPRFSSGKRRGIELSLPVYIAPYENWDATLTPHWMSARGFMSEAEFRHISKLGGTEFNIAGIRDTLTDSYRSRLQGNLHWQLPANISLDANADHVSDHDYLADFTNGVNASARYLKSSATLSQSSRIGELEGVWSMLVRHQQNMLLTSNAKTLQILPRLESHHIWSAHRNLNLHFEQQTTRFERRIGIYGWRMDLHPYVEIPWDLQNGGISATLKAESHHTRYWLSQDTAAAQNTRTALTETMPRRTTFHVSGEVRSDFERISNSNKWRHVFSPIIRYDHIDAPDQSSLPSFDATFRRLTLSNLQSGNRFSGYDRIERANRFSFLLENRLQHKSDINEAALEMLIVRAGMAYDLTQVSIDPRKQPVPTRPFSNLLGEIIWNPVKDINISSSGQYNTSQRYWSALTASASFKFGAGNSVYAGYRFTDARYSTEAQLITIRGKFRIAGRWVANGTWNYDSLLKLTQQTALGLQYHHPCWTTGIEIYRTNRRSGTIATSNYGFRLLLEFKGLGSVGS
jgi:lipopolysaccharide assembly outer membrane protein LptD (OstA)